MDRLAIFVAEKLGLITMVACNLRFHPGLQKIKEWLTAQRIGEIYTARAEFGFDLLKWRPGQDYRKNYAASAALGGGVILDAIHEMDYLYWFFGKALEISAFAGKVSDLELDAEDVAKIFVKFESAPFVDIHLDYLNPKYTRNLEIIGRKGTLTWDWQQGALLFDQNGKLTERFEAANNLDWNAMHLEELRYFLNCVAEKKQTLCPLAAGGEILEMALAAKESSATHQTIYLGKRGMVQS